MRSPRCAQLRESGDNSLRATDNESGLFMRIAMWNVQRPTSSDKRARLIDWVGRINADVWVLTDTHVELRPSTKHTAVHSSSGEHTSEVAVAIWSRYPMRQLPVTTDPAHAVAALLTLPDSSECVVYGVASLSEAYRPEWLELRRQHPAAEFCLVGQFNSDVLTLESAFIDAQLSCATQGDEDPVFAQTGGERSGTAHVALSADLAERVSGRGTWPAGTEPMPELSDHFGVFVDID